MTIDTSDLPTQLHDVHRIITRFDPPPVSRHCRIHYPGHGTHGLTGTISRIVWNWTIDEVEERFATIVLDEPWVVNDRMTIIDVTVFWDRVITDADRVAVRDAIEREQLRKLFVDSGLDPDLAERV
jgi:hypothetical protein